MSDLKQACLLLEVADEDLGILRVREDRSVFVDRVFGFTVQQAAEKVLKAWICLLGSKYPLSHDLGALMEQLSARGAEVASFAGLAKFTDYAGELCYVPSDPNEDPLDRESAIALVAALLERVKTLAAEAGA